MSKNSKISSSRKQRKSENFRKIKHGVGKHEKSKSKSNFKVGGSTVINLKNSQNLFIYLPHKQTEGGNLITGGK